MKPFDPIRAIKGDKVINRAGDYIRVLCIDAPGSHPVIAINNKGNITRHNLNGSVKPKMAHHFDLGMEAEVGRRDEH